MYLNNKFENNTKKYMKKTIIEKMLPLFYIMIIIICIVLYNFYNNNLKREFIPVSGITADSNQLILNYGQKATILAKVEPDNATFKGIMWQSSNPSLINVDSLGNITILKNETGESIITAKTNESGYKVNVKVKVIKKQTIVNVSGIDIENQNIDLKYGETKKLYANIQPSNATNKNIIWHSSNPNVVTVDKVGNIKVISNIDSNITITAITSEGNYKDSVIIKTHKINTISDIKVTGIKINSKETTLTYNSKYKLNAKLLPNNATNKNIIWSSSNPSLVSVDNSGNITILKDENGQSKISVKSVDGGYKDSVIIKVKKTITTNNNTNNNNTNNNNNNNTNNTNNNNTNNNNTNNNNTNNKDTYVPPKPQNIKVIGLTLDKSSLTLKYNEQIKVTATINPSNATNKNITWTSNNTNLITVDNQGNIKAKSGKIGIATITAKTADGGYTKSVQVKVVPSGNAISFKGGKNYSAYKTNILTTRTKAVMQSFAIHNDYMYISQQQASNAGAYYTRIKLEDIKKNPTDYQTFKSTFSILKDYGDAANIDIESTGNKNYLWTSCSTDDKMHCRIQLKNISYGTTTAAQTPTVSLSASGGGLVAVDNKNRIIVIMSGTKQKHTFTVYNLDDYVLNVGKATKISSFTIDKGNGNYSRQGFDVSGNYIYEVEGNNSYETSYQGIFISVYTLSGEMVTNRKEITKPDNNNGWEPEGLKVYNNKLYLGFSKISNKTSDAVKSQGVYILE